MKRYEFIEEKLQASLKEIEDLKLKLFIRESGHMARLRETSRNLNSMKGKYKASAVILSVQDLSGRYIINPTQIIDGLNEATIDQLRADLDTTIYVVKELV